MGNVNDLQLDRNTHEQRMSQDNCIFLARVGSQMYGTNTKLSDDDFTGIFMPDREYAGLGIKNINHVEYRTNPTGSGKRNTKEDRDCILYSLKQWVTLALNNNPNTLELFFAPEKCIMQISPVWEKLRANKHLFLSLKIYHSFRGYAHAQRMRLKLKAGNNTGRTDLIEKYGYDVKLASHNIRLYLECIQLLKEEQITFPLPERDVVIQIKTGEWAGDDGLKKFLALSDELAARCQSLYDNSKLRYSPAQEEINNFLVEIQEEYFHYIQKPKGLWNKLKYAFWEK
jgi:predicted nucleotidyltransferase